MARANTTEGKFLDWMRRVEAIAKCRCSLFGLKRKSFILSATSKTGQQPGKDWDMRRGAVVVDDFSSRCACQWMATVQAQTSIAASLAEPREIAMLKSINGLVDRLFIPDGAIQGQVFVLMIAWELNCSPSRR